VVATLLVIQRNTNKTQSNRLSRQAGLTLIEIMIVVAILAVTASIALPLYNGFMSEARISKAVLDMRSIELMVMDFADNQGRHPADLAELDVGDMRDPWGRPYQYLNIADAVGPPGKQRKDKFLVPVNSDFDLYSLGEDGVSSPPFTSARSHDDIVRANNGAFFGLAKDY
jgi:general secretion pathway protein G